MKKKREDKRSKDDGLVDPLSWPRKRMKDAERGK
jgi:hypothetical protein